MNGYEQTAVMLKALAHPVRLQILDLLGQEGEACVCHLETRLDQRQAYISQQLAKLREAGLVKDRREGLNVFYAPATKRIGQFIDEAKSLAAALAAADEIGLDFEAIPGVEPDECLCPSCEEKLSVATA